MFASVLSESLGMEDPGTVHPPMNTFFNYNKLLVQPDPESLVMRQRRALEQPITFMDSMDAALKPFTDVQNGTEAQDALREKALTIPSQFLESGLLPKDFQDYVKYMQAHPDRPVTEMAAPTYEGKALTDEEWQRQVDAINAKLPDWERGDPRFNPPRNQKDPEVERWWNVMTEIGKVGWNNLTPGQLQTFSTALGTTQASVGSGSSNWFYNNAAFRPLVAPEEQGRIMAQFTDARSQQAIAAAKSSPLNWQNWTAALGTGIVGMGMIRGIRGGMNRGGLGGATDLGGGGGYPRASDETAVPPTVGGDDSPAAKRLRLDPSLSSPEGLAAQTAATAHINPVIPDTAAMSERPVTEISSTDSAMSAASALRAPAVGPSGRTGLFTNAERAAMQAKNAAYQKTAPPPALEMESLTATTAINESERMGALGGGAEEKTLIARPTLGNPTPARTAYAPPVTPTLGTGSRASQLGGQSFLSRLTGRPVSTTSALVNDLRTPLLAAEQSAAIEMQAPSATGMAAPDTTAAPQTRTPVAETPVVGARPAPTVSRSTVPATPSEPTVAPGPDAGPSGMSSEVEYLGTLSPSWTQRFRATLTNPFTRIADAVDSRVVGMKQEQYRRQLPGSWFDAAGRFHYPPSLANPLLSSSPHVCGVRDRPHGFVCALCRRRSVPAGHDARDIDFNVNAPHDSAALRASATLGLWLCESWGSQ